MITAPRKIIVTHPRISVEIPKGMSPGEFFNSPANLKNLADENGLFRTPENFLMYRKMIGHSHTFDTSVILDTSRQILNPLGRPVRRDHLSRRQKRVWTDMTRIIWNYMVKTYPDPSEHLIMCGEASLDATWPLSKPGVPSIRMIHNHFIVYPMNRIATADEEDPANPNLTDSGHNSLFMSRLSNIYLEFMNVNDLEFLAPIETRKCRLGLTGYPQGLPCWKLKGEKDSINNRYFWFEYEQILKGFLDFYRTFFSLVSEGKPLMPKDVVFPDRIRDLLLSNTQFLHTAQEVREKVIENPRFATKIRWFPAYKQLFYRDDKGRFIVTISQNSVGNAITELLGIVVNRVEDDEAYKSIEGNLLDHLFEVSNLLQMAELGEILPFNSKRGVRS